MMHGNWFGNGMGSSWGGYGSFSIWHGLMILGVVVVLVGISMMRKSQKTHNNNPLELLKIQFANGNITEEEYLNKKNVLERK